MATTWQANKKGNELMSKLVHKYGDKIKLRTNLNDWIIKVELRKGILSPHPKEKEEVGQCPKCGRWGVGQKCKDHIYFTNPKEDEEDWKNQHCSGCTDSDPLGGTHCYGNIEHGPEPKKEEGG